MTTGRINQVAFRLSSREGLGERPAAGVERYPSGVATTLSELSEAQSNRRDN